MQRLARQLSPSVTTARPWAILLLLSLCAGGPALAAPALEYLDSGQWTFNKDCIARGDTLVTVLSYGAQIWDLTDPGAPQLVGDYYAAGRKTIKIDWLENLLALTTQDGWLQIVDAADPAAPTAASLTGGFGVTPAPLLQRRGADRLAFVAGSSGLRCLDLADPSAPLARDVLTTLNGAPKALAAHGDTLFVLADGYGLHSVATDDPDAFVWLDSDPIAASQLLDLDLDGSRLAVAARDDGLALFDLSDGADPVLVTLMPVELGGSPRRVKSVRVVGTLLYCAVDSEGIVIYDISDLAAPQLLGVSPGSWYNVEGLAVNGNLAYLNYWDGAAAGVQIFDVSAPGAQVWLGNTGAFDYCRNVTAQGDRIWTATGHQGVFLHQLVGDELVRRGQLPVLNTWAVQSRADTVFVAAASRGFVIGDWSDPDAPVEVGDLNLGLCRDVRVAGNLALVAVYDHGPATVDMSDPTQPVLLDQVEDALQTVALDLRGTLAATADRSGGVNLWDLSDPANIVWLANVDTGNEAVDLAFRPGFDQLAVAAGQVRILDVSDPTQPVQTAAFSAASTGVDYGPDGAIYVSRNGAGVSVWDPTWPLPVELDSYDTADNAYAVATAPGLAVVADYSALVVFRTGQSTAAPTLPLPTRLALTAQPNPFNPRTDLVFSLPRAGTLRVDIFDVNGRRLRRLAAGAFEAGEHRLRWDGSDDKGRALPSGIYLARLAYAGGNRMESGHAKLVLVR